MILNRDKKRFEFLQMLEAERMTTREKSDYFGLSMHEGKTDTVDWNKTPDGTQFISYTFRAVHDGTAYGYTYGKYEDGYFYEYSNKNLVWHLVDASIGNYFLWTDLRCGRYTDRFNTYKDGSREKFIRENFKHRKDYKDILAWVLSREEEDEDELDLLVKPKGLEGKWRNIYPSDFNKKDLPNWNADEVFKLEDTEVGTHVIAIGAKSVSCPFWRVYKVIEGTRAEALLALDEIITKNERPIQGNQCRLMENFQE